MKNIFIIFILTFSIAKAELFFKDSLDAKSDVIKFTPTTKTNAKYIVKVWGEYSQWNLSNPRGIGNDAVWYFDLPKYGNPIVDNLVKELIKEPLWFGDTTIYEIPLVNQKFSMLEYVGFRFNGNPLPKLERDTINHLYSIELNGTNSPFTIQIWDYVLNTSNNKREPRYDDNEGMLYVEIEEILQYEPVNCGITTIHKGDLNQIILRAELDLSQIIEVYYNGLQQFSINIECGDTLNLINSNTVLIDNSGSMNNPLDYISSESKYDLLLNELDKFEYENIISKKYIYLNDDDDIYRNTELLKKIYLMIDSLPYNENLIVFTDGYSEKDINYMDSIKIKLQSRPDLNIYIQLFLNDDFKMDFNKIEFYKFLLSYFKNGKLYTAKNRNELFENIKSLSRLIINDNCCYVSFITEECEDGSTIQLVNGNNTFNYILECDNSQIDFYNKKQLITSIDELDIDINNYIIYSVYGQLINKNDLIEGVYILVSKFGNDQLLINISNK